MAVRGCDFFFFFQARHPHSLSDDDISVTEKLKISQPVDSLSHEAMCELQTRSKALVIVEFSQNSSYWLLFFFPHSAEYHSQVIFLKHKQECCEPQSDTQKKHLCSGCDQKPRRRVQRTTTSSAQGERTLR